MAYEKDCAEILNLFKLAGKEIPHEDSDTGRAIMVLQEIWDSHDHYLPDAEREANDILSGLVDSHGWQGFEGNAACAPYIFKGEYRFDGEVCELAAKACAIEGIEIDFGSDIFEAIETLESSMNSDDDFNFEFDGNEYRIIKDSAIWDIYRDEIQNTVEECYTDVIQPDKIPAFIAFSIDWEQTAKNAYADGYGHQFSSYDGSEEESAGYYIFRTN